MRGCGNTCSTGCCAQHTVGYWGYSCCGSMDSGRLQPQVQQGANYSPESGRTFVPPPPGGARMNVPSAAPPAPSANR